MQKALVKKKLINFTKTIPKFSDSEELKKKNKLKKKTQKTKKREPNPNLTPFPHTGETTGKKKKKPGQINKTQLCSLQI